MQGERKNARWRNKGDVDNDGGVLTRVYGENCWSGLTPRLSGSSSVLLAWFLARTFHAAAEEPAVAYASSVAVVADVGWAAMMTNMAAEALEMIRMAAEGADVVAEGTVQLS
jgi:hypothetical protein